MDGECLLHYSDIGVGGERGEYAPNELGGGGGVSESDFVEVCRDSAVGTGELELILDGRSTKKGD